MGEGGKLGRKRDLTGAENKLRGKGWKMKEKAGPTDDREARLKNCNGEGDIVQRRGTPVEDFTKISYGQSGERNTVRFEMIQLKPKKKGAQIHGKKGRQTGDQC